MTRPQPPRPVRRDDVMLVVADPAPEEVRSPGTSPAGRHEALLAVARAAYAAGRPIAVPADAGVSMLLATVALEYAGLNRGAAETVPLLIVMESGPAHLAARALLAPFVQRGVVDYRDENFAPVADATAVGLPDVIPEVEPRQPVTTAMIRSARGSIGFGDAILVSSARRSLDDLEALRAEDVPTKALLDTAHDAEIEEELARVVDDPRGRRFRDDFSDDPFTEEFSDEIVRRRNYPLARRPPAAPPYSDIAQQFVADRRREREERDGGDDLG